MSPKLSAKCLVLPDISINRLVRDPQLSSGFEGAADLFRAPFLAQPATNQLEILFPKVTVAPGSASPGPSAPLGLTGAIGTVSDVASIPLQLPVNSASVAPQTFGDMADRKPLHSELANAYPVYQGELRVHSHR